MERNPRAHHPDALLAHREWVERAARALVYGDADADDLQQEAWLKVLTHPPAEEPRSPRGWLWSVLRNATIDAGRRAKARRRHEEAAARPETVDASPADLVERAETLTRIARAVLELEEPYRSTVLLRYFEDRDARAIAELQGIPVETVRTRLKRAVGRLREKLDAENGGDRKRWCLALVPLLRLSPPTAATAGAGTAASALSLALGGVLMTKKTVAAVAVVLLLLSGGWIAVNRLREGAGTGSSTPSGVPDVAAVRPPIAVKKPEPAVTAEPDPSPPPPAATAGEDPMTGSVLVTVRWPDGTPAEGIWIQIQAETGRDDPWNVRTVRTGKRGTALFERLPRGTAWVRADRNSNSGDRVKVGPAETPTPYSMTMADGFTVEGIVVDREDRPFAGATVWMTLGGRLGEGFPVAESANDGTFRVPGVVGLSVMGARSPGQAPSVQTILSGAPGSVQSARIVLRGPGGLVTGIVLDPAGAPVPGALVNVGPDTELMELGETGSEGMQLHGLVVETDAEGKFRASGVRPGAVPVKAVFKGFSPWKGQVTVDPGGSAEVVVRLAGGATLEGHVLDAEGKGVKEATVTVNSDTGEFHSYCLTADDGSYRILDLPPGEYRVVAQRIHLGKVQERRRFEAGKTAVWEARLSTGLVLAGRVLDGEGEPRKGWLVSATTMEPAERAEDFLNAGVWTDAEGRFRLDNAPDRALRVKVDAPGSDRRTGIPTKAVEGVRPGGEPIEIRVPLEILPTAFIRGILLDPEGRPFQAARVNIARAGDPIQRCEIYPAPKDGAFSIGPISPGDYALEVSAPDLPPFPLGTRTVARGETLDLGTIRMEGPAFLVLRIRTEMDLPPASIQLKLFNRDGLAASEYRLPVKDGVARYGPVGPADYSVNVMELAPGSSSGRTRAQLVAGRDVTAEVTLRAGKRHFLQLDYSEGAAEGLQARVIVRDTSGAIVFEDQAMSSIQIGAQGKRTRIPGLSCTVTLAPGDWQVEAVTPEGLRGTATFSVPDGKGQPSITHVALR